MSRTTVGLYPLNLIALDNEMLLDSIDAAGVRSLWRTNGTAAGTQEIGGPQNQGVNGAYAQGLLPQDMTLFNGKVLFQGMDSAGHEGLWVSDGTAAGTTEIGGLGNQGISNASVGALQPTNMVVFNGRVFFRGTDSGGSSGLWMTDGTAAGTSEIGGLGDAGISGASSAGITPTDLTAYNGMLLFSGRDNSFPGSLGSVAVWSYGLWVSDGTAAGTTELGGLQNAGISGASSEGLQPTDMTVFNGKVLFAGLDGISRYPSPSYIGLWVTDGTASGTVEMGGRFNQGVTGANPAGLHPSEITVLNGVALFRGSDSANTELSLTGETNGLWVTDGTVAGTVEIGGLNDAGVTGAGTAGLRPQDLTMFNGKVYFEGTDALGDLGLWVTDGTAAGTYEIGGLGNRGVVGASSAGLNPSLMTVFDGKLIFSGAGADGVSTLWQTDGTAAGTHRLGMATPNDFVGNGVSDIFWQNTSSGAVGEWLMAGGGSGQIASAPNLGNASGITILGTGDFNGDGVADVLIEQSDGTLGEWLMSNGQIAAAPGLGTMAADVKVAAIGNFAGNGIDDIFWQNTSTGQIGEWLMDPRGTGQIVSAPAFGVQPASLQILGAGDFTGNGTDDVFWQQSDGTVGEWLMSNGQISSGITLGATPAGLQILGFGDFNGDGTDDVFWRSGNTVGEWLMQNGQIHQSVTLGNVAATWQFVGTGDFTGNGTDDVVWRDGVSGNLIEWQMSNGQINQAPILGQVGSDVKMIVHA
ncbi:MAG: FG-GAP-like repeat-containing protein [Pseudomonadota bacterium]